MFGVIHIRLPQFAGGKRRSGILGALAVGAASGLVVGPCTGPGLAVMVAMISSAASTGAARELVFGIAVMFAYSIGMGGLMILCGTFSGFLARLSRSGKWLNVVERSFAALMLGAALHHPGQPETSTAGTYDSRISMAAKA